MFLGRFFALGSHFGYFGFDLRDKSPLTRFGKLRKEFVKEINTKFVSFGRPYFCRSWQVRDIGFGSMGILKRGFSFGRLSGCMAPVLGKL